MVDEFHRTGQQVSYFVWKDLLQSKKRNVYDAMEC